MNRKLRQSAYVQLGFESVCRQLEQHAGVILSQATRDATSKADHLVLHLDHDVHFFNPAETVTLRASPLMREDRETASMRLQWRSDHGRRILPALDAQLDIHAIIRSGPSASTALTVTGLFTPPTVFRRRSDETLFKRKLVDVVVYQFVHSAAEALDRAGVKADH